MIGHRVARPGWLRASAAILSAPAVMYWLAGPAISDRIGSGNGEHRAEPLPVSTEASPPDVLDVSVVASSQRTGRTTVEVRVKPALNAEVQLEIDAPSATNLRGGRTAERLSLSTDDGADYLRRVSIDVSHGNPTGVRARLWVFSDAGEPYLVIDRSVTFNEPPADASAERVPVLLSLPDGRRVVEYMTRSEAARRGLMPSVPQAVMDAAGGSPDTDAGGDAPDADGTAQ